MSYNVSKLTTLGQIKTALQRVQQQITAVKSTCSVVTITASNWVSYNNNWRYMNIQATSSKHFYDVHLDSNSTDAIGIMCANADIHAKVESNQINLYCYGTKPTNNFDVEIIITNTSTNNVGLSYDIGNDFRVVPSVTDGLDTRVTTLENTTVPAVQAEVDALEIVVANQVLTAQNVSVAANKWVASGVTAYPYKAELNISEVTADHFPLVQFRDEDSSLYNLSPSVSTSAGKLTIYCATQPAVAITIPTIFCIKGTNVTVS